MSNPQPPPLSVTLLFQPMSSGVGQNGAVPLSPPQDTWLYDELEVAAQILLPTTAWQSGGAERELLAITAVCFSQSDAMISFMAQGAFLSTAATGTVTYQALNGQQITAPVTPDPSNPAQNATGALGWLDLTTQGVYNVYRLPATYATGPLAIVNTTTSTVGPYAVGSYRTASQTVTYTNTTSLAIPSSVIPLGGGTITGWSGGMTSSILSCSAPPAVGTSVYVNIPVTSGVTGLAGVFAIVTATASNTFSIAVGSSGAFSSPSGQVYTCTVATMQAQILGTAGNAAPGAVRTTVTQNTGVACYNILPWSCSNWESNQALANRARQSMFAASPNGPSQAYEYFAESAELILANQTPSYQLTNGAVSANAFANPQTGIETIVVASETPQTSTLGGNVTPGCAQALVTAASNTIPIVLALNGPCGMTTGMTCIVSGVLGNQGANGTFTVTTSGASSTSVTLNGSTGTGAYTSGGTVEGGDLGMIDNLLQDNVVPDAIVAAETVSALALPVVVVASVVVPAAYVTTYQLAVQAAIAQQTGSYPIGGVYDPQETVPVAWEDYIGAVRAAGILTLGSNTYVLSVPSLSVTVNGTTMTASPQSVPFPTNQYQAIQSTITVQVTGV